MERNRNGQERIGDTPQLQAAKDGEDISLLRTDAGWRALRTGQPVDTMSGSPQVAASPRRCRPVQSSSPQPTSEARENRGKRQRNVFVLVQPTNTLDPGPARSPFRSRVPPRDAGAHVSYLSPHNFAADADPKDDELHARNHRVRSRPHWKGPTRP